MITGDMSNQLPRKMVKDYEDALFRLRSIFLKWHFSGRSDRDCNLILYLMRRAWRPIYQELRRRYVKLWGPKASFSYFFPDHTHNAIWFRVTDRLQRKPRPCSRPSPVLNI